MAREVVAAAGLKETVPDAPLDAGVPFAHGHSARWPLGRRLVIPGNNPTRALAAATGFVSTAADLARFFASLAVEAPRSILSPASRREMLRRQWRDPHGTPERWYGLGTISATLGNWEHFGHSGGFQGTLTRTLCVPAQGLALSVLTNAADGLAQTFADGALHILRGYARHGPPTQATRAWRGRWWSLWGAFDLVPLADRVLVANPTLANPFQDASEITPEGPSRGRITLAGGFANHGEPAHLRRGTAARGPELLLGGEMTDGDAHFYDPREGRGLPHDPFNAIVGPRPIGWISSHDGRRPLQSGALQLLQRLQLCTTDRGLRQHRLQGHGSQCRAHSRVRLESGHAPAG